MSSLPLGSQSPGSRTSNPTASVEDVDVERIRNFIQESKSLGCSPEETSATSTREAVSESFVDALTIEEIEEIGKRIYNQWEKCIKTGEKAEVDESKIAQQQGSDPKIQSEEAVTSFEDAKSEVAPSAESHHDIGKFIETELRNIREAKMSEGDAEKTHQVGKLRRSENMDFTELKKKAADLPVISDLMCTQQTRQLPVLRKTDPLEMVLRIYECIYTDPAETIDLSPEMTKDQEFQKRLVIEMRILHGRLVGGSKERADSIIEEAEGESSSSIQTKDSADPSLMSPLGQSTTFYPEDTTNSAGPPREDDSLASTSHTLDTNSLSGLVNVPELTIPEGAKKQSSAESGNSNSTTSSTTVCSDDTLSDISSLPTDTSGARTSVSSLRDADALVGSQIRVPQFQIEDATDDDAFTPPLTKGDAAGPSHLAVPQVARLPSSLDDSTENAEAEDVGNERRRRERSPMEDENNKAPKRQAL